MTSIYREPCVFLKKSPTIGGPFSHHGEGPFSRADKVGCQVHILQPETGKAEPLRTLEVRRWGADISRSGGCGRPKGPGWVYPFLRGSSHPGLKAFQEDHLSLTSF